ncbi:hypothetical protein vseg_021495 [Gypsophila vaccaria]
MNNNDNHETNNQESPKSPCSKNKNNTTSSSIKEQDKFLPIANVGRIMKKVIPVNGKISKDAKEAVQECVSEFISFVTGEAADKCQREKRKTINGDDVIWAIVTLGFEDYVNPLKVYLSKYREIEGEKLNVPRQQRSDQIQVTPQQQQQQQQDEFNQQVEQVLSPYANNNTSVYSSNLLLLPQPPSFQPFSLPFSPTSIQNNYQEQIDSVGQW